MALGNRRCGRKFDSARATRGNTEGGRDLKLETTALETVCARAEEWFEDGTAGGAICR